MEMPLRRYSGFMRGDANTSLTKEAMQLMVEGQVHLRGIGGRVLVSFTARSTLVLSLSSRRASAIARSRSPPPRWLTPAC